MNNHSKDRNFSNNLIPFRRAKLNLMDLLNDMKKIGLMISKSKSTKCFLCGLVAVLFIVNSSCYNKESELKAILEISSFEYSIKNVLESDHDHKYRVRINFKNNSKDTIGMVLAVSDFAFVIPGDPPPKNTCEVDSLLLGVSISNGENEMYLYPWKANELIINPKSENSQLFMVFNLDLDEKIVTKLITDGELIFYNPCDSISSKSWPNINWLSAFRSSDFYRKER